jgi:hypothetical protein
MEFRTGKVRVGRNLDLRIHGLSCSRRSLRSLTLAVLAIGAVAILNARSTAQTTLPFAVSNPKHLDFSMEEAGRIYFSACERVARSVQAEKPLRLEPRFVLVLGAKADETVRENGISQIQLRVWDPTRFAEAMVLLSLRELLKKEDIANLTRDTLMAANASVSVEELKRK